jgi:TIR domain
MVFVSYSHADYKWFERFSTMVSPLRRQTEISVWSDKEIRPGQDWPPTIRNALDAASVAVLLVSDNFLASDFIAKEELPYIFRARKERGVEILWLPLSHCHFDLTELSSIQAVSDPARPLNSMVESEYQSVLRELCDRINEAARRAETPTINKALSSRKLKRFNANLQVLARPAKRETEVLVYSGDKRWHTQSRIAKGSMTCDCWIGDEHTNSGDAFKIIAITRLGHLSPKSSHLNIPIHRTKSEEVRVTRE